MNTPPAHLDVPQFERKLRSRLGTLREQIRTALLHSDAEAYGRLAGEVHDVEEEALADLFVDVNLADITREVEEVRDIDAALRRILVGTYGRCIGCGEPIDQARLDAYLTAKRCLECQRTYDRSRLTPSTPTL
jgi:DnaK suppressor protein